MYTYKTRGTCSTAIHLDIQDDVIRSCTFDRGCGGNTQGVGRLVTGMRVEDVIKQLKGIECQNGTSCPDQLATALEAWQREKAGA